MHGSVNEREMLLKLSSTCSFKIAIPGESWHLIVWPLNRITTAKSWVSMAVCLTFYCMLQYLSSIKHA